MSSLFFLPLTSNATYVRFLYVAVLLVILVIQLVAGAVKKGKQNKPQNLATDESNVIKPPKLLIWLTIVPLGIMVVLAAFTALIMFGNGEPGIGLVALIVCILSVVSLVMLVKMKQLGFYLLIAACAFSLILCVLFEPRLALIGLIPVFVIAYPAFKFRDMLL